MILLEQVMDLMPVGFRFKPTDQELVNHYLRNKILGNEDQVQILPEIDICKCEPWCIPGQSRIKSDDPEWFFFCPPDYKYKNSCRSNRGTKQGYWKATGRDRDVKIPGTNHVIATKKTLVFYKGRVPKGLKTEWVIHEYLPLHPPKSPYVLCRLMKQPKGSNDELGEQGIQQVIEDTFPEIHTTPQEDLGSLLFPEFIQAQDRDLSSILQSPINIQQSPSSSNFPFCNGYSTQLDNAHLLSDTDQQHEQDMDFVNSILVPDHNNPMAHAVVNDYAMPLSLNYEDGGLSSDTDIDITARYLPEGNREIAQTKLYKSQHGAVHASGLLSSNRERDRKEGKHICCDEILGGYTSSGDSNADPHYEINCIQIARDEESPTSISSYRTQYNPRSNNLVSYKAAARISHTQNRVIRKVVTKEEADQKENSIVDSNNSQRKAQVTDSKRNLSSSSGRRSWKTCFSQMETLEFSQNPRPRFAYLLNMVVGIFLFTLIIWEIISCAWCC